MALLVVAVGALLWGVDTKPTRTFDDVRRRGVFGTIAIAVGAATALVAWTVRYPIDGARGIGTVGIVLLALVVLAGIGQAAGYFAENTDPPKLLFFVFNRRRIPVFTLFVIWLGVLILFPAVFTHQHYHGVDVADAEAVPSLAITHDRIDGLTEDGEEGPCTRWVEDLAGHGIAVEAGPDGRIPQIDAAALSWEPEAAGREGFTVEEAFHRWLCANSVSSTSAGDPVPLVIVSSWGGGIRAATWAALVTDHLFDPDDGIIGGPRSIFALSGISGGSLGFLEYAAYATSVDDEAILIGVDNPAPLPPVATSGSNAWVDGQSGPEGWVQFALGDDYLSPVAARLLYVDIPLNLIGYVGGVADRGDLLERAWERSWGMGSQSALRQGLLQTWITDLDMPLVIANGTSTVDSCSFNGSVLDESVESDLLDLDYQGQSADDCTTLRPFEDFDGLGDDEEVGRALVGTRDLSDFLCDGTDVRLSATALMSARFPYVTPSGFIERDCDDDPPRPPMATNLIDGGYHEGSGAATTFQLWEALEPLIAAHNEDGGQIVVPFLIHIENGYKTSHDPVLAGDPKSEWIVPIVNSGAESRLVEHLRSRAALAFSGRLLGADGNEIPICLSAADPCPDELDNRYAFITTRNHPGVQAPLGWVLSEESILDLHAQLAVNAEEFAEIARWREMRAVPASGDDCHLEEDDVN
jgi:hypothetical protein